MNGYVKTAVFYLVLLALQSMAWAQGRTNPLPVDLAERQWASYASMLYFVVPDYPDFLSPTITLDLPKVHFEARYNYEDINTASLWCGYNIQLGDSWKLDLIPMAGATFGSNNGLALGYELSFRWWRFELYSESELLIVPGASNENFFNTWAELNATTFDWMHVGLVLQRTRIYRSSLEVHPGFSVGVSLDPMDLTISVFNLGWEPPMYVLAAAFAL